MVAKLCLSLSACGFHGPPAELLGAEDEAVRMVCEVLSGTQLR